ncbi:glycoside hydrolase family 36 protein [Enterococcus canis]|nr:glycoside hydrolase family 36 protein [Enterococcus canis]
MNELIYHKFTLGQTQIVFAETPQKQLRLLHMGPDQFDETVSLDPEFVAASTLVEIQITGLNQPDHKGNKLGNTLVGRNLVLDKLTQKGNILEITQSYQQDSIQLTVVTTLIKDPNAEVFTWQHVTTNQGKEIGLEYVTTLNVIGLNNGAIYHRYSEDVLYIPHNSWQGELQWRHQTLKEYGLEYCLDGEKLQDATKVVEVTNETSWSCSQFSPMGVVYSPHLDQTTFWQIEHNGEWHWELTDAGFGKYLAIRAGGPTEPTNHWWKKLQNGEQFTTIPVAYGVIKGSFEQAMQQLTTHRRDIRRNNQDNQKCPVIFNDYMNSLMGDPTTAKELPMIDKAAQIGCEYYVVDCGWYSDGYWWDNVGEWLPSKERFPEGIEFLMNYIRDKGMVPGLWLEIEVMGINSDFANSLPDEWFICRHGERIRDHSRYHLDFRHPDVRSYATSVVKRLVDEYKVGYIKMDYNTPTGIGSDIQTDSFSDALLQHNRAYLAWLDEIFTAYPELIIENCGSGGMRHDYQMLARHSIQSVTDQTDYLRNGAIAAVSATAVTPEQAAIWSYPLQDGDTEEVIYNMINAMLFRIHQSGHLAELCDERLALVAEGITTYKTFREVIPTSQPVWYTGLPHLDDEWFTCGLETSEAIYLAVWRTNSLQNHFDIPLPTPITSVKLLYPQKDQKTQYLYTSQQLSVYFPDNKMARLYKLQK